MKAGSALALAAAAVIFCGCGGGARNQIYYWDGSYTDSTYQYLKQEGDVGEQIEALEKSIQKAYEKGLASGAFVSKRGQRREGERNF